MTNHEEEQRVSQIKSSINDLLKSAKKYFKLALIFMFINSIYITFGAFMFLYIEQCLHKFPDYISKAENERNEFCNFFLSQNFTNANYTKLSQLNDICSRPIEKFKDVGCHVTKTSFKRWVHYAITVVFTVGMLYIC